MGVILVVAGFHVFEGIPRQSVGAEYSATFSALIIFHVFYKHKKSIFIHNRATIQESN